jgi:hypothetical protein
MADVKITALPTGVATATSIVPVVNGTTTQRVTVKSIVDLATAAMPSGTVDTTATGPITGLTASPNLPIQQWSEEMALKAAFKDTPVTFTRVDIQGPGDLGDFGGGAGWLSSTSAIFGTLLYGSGGPIRAGGAPGYELPTPTKQGYLRADLDPASGWYFAEPVIVSDTAPPTPPGDPALPTIWAKPVDAASAPASKGITLAQVQSEIDAKLAALPAGEAVDTAAIAAAILPDIRKTLNGGVVPPPDITTWTPCPITSFINPKPQSSTVEVIQLNGVLYFRGSFLMPAGSPTTSAAGGFAYLELPAGFTRPKADTRVILLGRVSPGAPAPVIGVGEVRSAISLINVMVPGCDTIYFDNVSVRIG